MTLLHYKGVYESAWFKNTINKSNTLLKCNAWLDFEGNKIFQSHSK